MKNNTMPTPEANTNKVCHRGVLAEKYKTSKVMPIIPNVLRSLWKSSAVVIKPKKIAKGTSMYIIL